MEEEKLNSEIKIVQDLEDIKKEDNPKTEELPQIQRDILTSIKFLGS